ncbi:MAG: AI-2E family transporter [Anaerolineales bacterium]|nr:AI-2E family transporter [Anaerolineales bacterium]
MRTTNINPVLSPLTQMMLIGGGFVLIVTGMRAASEMVNTILLAFVITLLSAPLYRQLIRRHVPPFVAIALILLLFIVILVGLGVFLAVSLNRFEANLAQYKADLIEKTVGFIQQLSDNGFTLANVVPISDSFNFQSMIGNAFNIVGRILSSFASLFTNMGLVVLIVFFALFEVTAVPERLVQGLGENNNLLQRFYDMNQSIRTYFWIKTQTGLLTAVANTILLLVLGVDFALLWDVLSFLFNFIPNIGFLIALIPVTIVTFLQYGMGKALIVVIGYVLINFIVDNILSPKLMGRGLNLSPAIVFIALIFWTWVLGILGAILAVPFLIIVKTIVDSDEGARWLSLIISGNVPQAAARQNQVADETNRIDK